MDTKPWWTSVTIWSSVLAGIASFFATFGVDWSSQLSSLAPLLAALGGVLAPAMAIYGRLRAGACVPVTQAQQTNLMIAHSALRGPLK